MQTLSEYLADKHKGNFARSVGIVPAYLSQILGGIRTPSFSLMVRIERETGGAVPVSSWVNHEDMARDVPSVGD